MPVIDASTTDDRPLDAVVAEFLAGLTHANRSVYTRRAYGADLARFCAFSHGTLATLSAETLRAYFATLVHLSPASRARKQASLASFLHWTERQGLLATSPMARVDRVKLDPPGPRGAPRQQIDAILAVIPPTRRRDRVLFQLIRETGVRVGEALALYVEDLDLTTDDEHIRVLGKGGQRRTVLLDDPHLVRGIRAYLQATGYRFGPLFRAEKNGRGGPLRYQSAHERWAGYCARAGVTCTLHQLRHTHATELVNAGVSLATIRKRLGHKNLQTTLRYAEQSDATADAELRGWRRRQLR